MSYISLSYVLTTYNKIDYLKVVLPGLISNRKSDEEIIIVDGASTDGTAEYLKDLFAKGDIDYFVSEKDYGEAHGFNKGMTAARGELIKIVTDDDAYWFPAIDECKKYMLLHPEIDVMGGNTGNLRMDDKNTLFLSEYFEEDFLKWKEGELRSFFFNGTCLMIRKSSLPVTGLFNTGGLLTDMEYSLRISTIAKLAWCRSVISVRMLNAHSNNVLFSKRAEEESNRLCNYYGYMYPWDRRIEEEKKLPVYRKIRRFLGRTWKAVISPEKKIMRPAPEPFLNFSDAFLFCTDWLKNHPLNRETAFIIKQDTRN